MSFLAQYPGRWAVGGLTVIGSYLYLAKPPAPRGDESPISFSTTGVQNIEKAYTNAGATPTHTPAYGGTSLGDKEDVALKEGGGTGTPSKKNPHEKEGVGSDQRPASSSTGIEKAFQQTNVGTSKGK